MNHDIRVDLDEFAELASGRQAAVLKMDNNFALGDTITLREFDTRRAKETDRTLTRRVSHILNGARVMNGGVLSPHYSMISLGLIVQPNGLIIQDQTTAQTEDTAPTGIQLATTATDQATAAGEQAAAPDSDGPQTDSEGSSEVNAVVRALVD